MMRRIMRRMRALKFQACKNRIIIKSILLHAGVRCPCVWRRASRSLPPRPLKVCVRACLSGANSVPSAVSDDALSVAAAAAGSPDFYTQIRQF